MGNAPLHPKYATVMSQVSSMGFQDWYVLPSTQCLAVKHYLVIIFIFRAVNTAWLNTLPINS